jgi:DNA-binding CsgD family transcriptional regulator
MTPECAARLALGTGMRLISALRAGRMDEVPALCREFEELNTSWGRNHRRETLPAVDARLTVQEARVIRLATEGYGTRDIAKIMKIQPGTVKVHLRSARKRGVQR